MRRLALTILMIAAGMLIAIPVTAQNPSYLSWRQYESDHFIVYYPEGEELTAFESLEVAEAVREPLENMYGPIKDKISIVIRDDEDYANGGAFFYDNKIEISATSLDFDFRSYTDWLWNVVTHELTHIYSINTAMKAPRWIPMAYYQHVDYQQEKREDVLLGYPNVLVSYPVPLFNIPAWLAEGAAQYQARDAQFDRWDAHRDMIVRQASLNGTLLTLDQMAIFNWTGRENEMVYNHGYALVQYITRRFGDQKLSALLRAMSATTAITFDIACHRTLGISADDLYRDWETTLTAHYEAVRDSLGTLVEGDVFRAGGFLNLYPTWSPDGSRLAYVSNKGQDYSLSACFVANLSPEGWSWKGIADDRADVARKIEDARQGDDDPNKLARTIAGLRGSLDIALGGGIQSAPLWLDEWNILFNRRMPADKYGSHWWDMYRYVINRADPRDGSRVRITENLRGTYPDLSPDGGKLVFVKNGEGLNNLWILHRGDNSQTPLTDYRDGSGLYRPRWSPDGSRIAFTIRQGSEVNIAAIDSTGDGFTYLVSSSGQDRDPAWSSDGSALYFSSDVTGIPNIYRLDMSTGGITRLTNVLGGAFSPAPSPGDTTLAFSNYGPDGYEIRLMTLDGTGIPVDTALFHRTVTYTPPAFDKMLDPGGSQRYEMRTLDFSFMPVVRNDQGNLKLGTYLTKTEVTDNASFLAFGAISPKNRDTDLFALFEYRRFIPTVFVEMYRQTRSVDTDENFMEEFGTYIRRRAFDLNEIDFGLRYNYHDDHRFEGRLIYSRYNARLEYTHFLTGQEVHRPSYTYSQGFDLALSYGYDSYQRARDEVINPRGGRSVSLRYDRFLDFFLSDFENVGFLKEQYTRYPYDRFFVNWIERIPVPGTKKHTLNLRGQANIIDRQVDEFYELQLGGPQQMRGYTFYSLSGRKNLMFQALYRFPLLYDMRKNMLAWYFNHLYMGVFADIGRAWNKRSLNWSTDGFKRDAGIELRLDAVSFYNFPTMVEFAAAYGPDDTWLKQFDEQTSQFIITKDKQDPWKYYFSILFGFN